MFSHTPGFFSTAADSCPVMGIVLVCRALAMAERRVSSVQPGPTPTFVKIGKVSNFTNLVEITKSNMGFCHVL